MWDIEYSQGLKSIMSELDRETIEQRLHDLNNPRLAVAFAVRCALRVLPRLVTDIDDKRGFLWFWEVDKRARHLLAVLRAYMVAYHNIGVADAAAVRDAVHAARDAAHAGFDAGFDARTAAFNARDRDRDTEYYAASVAEYAAFAARDAAFAACFVSFTPADVANAADAADDAARADADVAIIIVAELNTLTSNTEAQIYLQQPLTATKTSPTQFITQLKAFGQGFDYWANWLEARWQGQALDLEELKVCTFLSKEILAQSPADINAYLKSMRRGAVKPLNRVRAIFIGYGAAGKTSIIRALHGEKARVGCISDSVIHRFYF